MDIENAQRLFIFIARILLPLVAVLFFVFSTLPLLRRSRRKKCGFALLDNQRCVTLNNSENILGCTALCDVRIRGAAAHHAVISVFPDGCWISPLDGNEVLVNGHLIAERTAVEASDTVMLAGCELQIRRVDDPQPERKARSGHDHRPLAFGALCLFQLLLMGSEVLAHPADLPVNAGCFSAFLLVEFLYFGITGFRRAAEIGMQAGFLLSIGLCVAAELGTEALVKQGLCFLIGFAGALILYQILQRRRLTDVLYFPAMIAGVLLLLLTIVLGVSYNGSRNWIEIAGYSLQPSELVKVILVFLSAASGVRMFRRGNTAVFFAFSVVCMACLAYMRDFGTLMLYFAVLLETLFLRQCHLNAIIFTGGTAAVGAGAVALFFPYVAARLLSFGHAWENAADSGYQQTRAMIAAASGGLLGLGSGNGMLLRISAGDTDLVFGLVTEQWGFLVALCVLGCFLTWGVVAIRRMSSSHDLYVGITAGVAAVLFLLQTALNVFGSMDLLPFTGVTLPFVSNGGSSMIACMLLLTFLCAGDAEGRILPSSVPLNRQ